MENIPILFKSKEDCCGCTACYAICPKMAISMVEDEEDFDYPQIDEKSVFDAINRGKVKRRREG